jgi:hypothetical protein
MVISSHLEIQGSHEIAKMRNQRFSSLTPIREGNDPRSSISSLENKRKKEYRQLGLSQLSDDLLCLILSHLQEEDSLSKANSETMSCLRLANRRLYHLVSFRLYQHMDLRSRKQFKRFFEILACPKETVPGALRFCQWVRSVDLSSKRSACVQDRHIAMMSSNPCLQRNLRDLNLSGCRHVTDRALSSLLRQCHALRHLWINDLDKITDAAFQPPNKEDTGTSKDGTLKLSKSLRWLPPALRVLELKNCSGLTSLTVHYLAHHQLPLQHFHVSTAKFIHGSSIVHLCQESNHHLQSLHIAMCGKFTDTCLESIALHAYKLRHVELDKNYGRLTANGVDRFVTILDGVLESLRVVMPMNIRPMGVSVGSGWHRVKLFPSNVDENEFRMSHPYLKHFSQD